MDGQGFGCASRERLEYENGNESGFDFWSSCAGGSRGFDFGVRDCESVCESDHVNCRWDDRDWQSGLVHCRS